MPQKDGKLLTKRFADCSRNEIRAAVREARGHEGGGGGSIPREDAREVGYLRQELRNALGLDSPASLKAVFRNGMTMVTLENIPLHEVKSVCQALGWPEGPPAPGARRGARREL